MMAYKIKKAKVVFTKKVDGVKFRIRETGQNWTIDVKEKDSDSFKRIQSVSDLKLAKQIVENQKEFHK
jgi:hypothetical protein